MALVDREIKTLSTDYNINVIRNSNGMYANCIPVKIRNKYNSAFREAGYFNGGYLPGELDSDTNLSIIASHVANTMISTIETETLFSGDSAFYKYKYNGTKEVDINGNKIKIRTLSDKYSDKIKRLGSVLSTGQNLRVDYDDNATFTEVKIDDEIIKGYPELEDRTYTFATVADVKLASNYLKQSKTSFAKQYLIDLIDK